MNGRALQTRYVESLHSWYGADGRLRVVDRRTCHLFIDGTGGWKCDSTRPPPPNERSAFEEYRYDALGRRVLVRSRQEFACTSRCVRFVRRTVWDGDQVLGEIQAPGQTGTPAATMEKDVGFSVAAASSVVPDTADAPPSSTSHYYPGYYHGRVLYTHGPGIDHPLAITAWSTAVRCGGDQPLAPGATPSLAIQPHLARRHPSRGLELPSSPRLTPPPARRTSAPPAAPWPRGGAASRPSAPRRWGSRRRPG
ncbi:MAG: hypothetical protein JWM27_4048 [Gemmatimonadetes bacterium]|nr:hypothetical protein [Gemmatimonadota bacterium]